MIQRKFFHYNRYEDFAKVKVSMDPENTTFMVGFDDKIWDGEPDIPYHSIVFIKDRRLLVTHGQVYDTSGENLEQEGDLFIPLADFEVETVFDSPVSDPGLRVEEFIEYAEAGVTYYNNLPGVTVSKYSGFSMTNPETKILSRYPMNFVTPDPRRFDVALTDVHNKGCVAYVEDSGEFYIRSISYSEPSQGTHVPVIGILRGGEEYRLSFTVWSKKPGKIHPRILGGDGEVILDFGEVQSEVVAKRYDLMAETSREVETPDLYFDLPGGSITEDWIRFSNIILEEKDLVPGVSEVKKAQYLDSLTTESGLWVYSLRYFPLSPFDDRSIILVNGGIYE